MSTSGIMSTSIDNAPSYKIITCVLIPSVTVAETSNKLAERVKNEIVNGYKPVGGVSFAQNNNGIYLLQAMYKNPAAAAGGGGTKRSKNRSRRQ